MYHYLLILIFLFVTLTASSQESSPDSSLTKKQLRKQDNRFIGFGYNFMLDHVKDPQVSPLIYSGLGTGAYTSLLRINPKKIDRTDLMVTRTQLNNKFSDENDNDPSTGTYIRLSNSDFYHHKKIFKERGNLFIGYVTNIQFNIRTNPRFMNAGLSYDLFANIGPAIRLDRDFAWKEKDLRFLFFKSKRKERSIRLAWEVDFPVINFISRPNYTTIVNARNGDVVESLGQNIIKNFRINSLNDFVMVNSKMELYYKLRNNNNMLRFAYLWQVYSYNYPNYSVSNVASGVTFSYIFKFDKNKNY